MRRRALITGATGFVGSHLAEQLTSQGWLVRALVRRTSDTSRLIQLGVVPFVGELGEPESVSRAAEECELVYHLAAATFEKDEASFHRANVEGTRGVVEGSLRTEGVRRLVYLSSYAASGASRGAEPRSSADPPAPLTAYGRTKLAGEELVREAAGRGLETVIVRAPAVYGPRDTALLSYFRLVRWGLAPAPGGGERYLHLIYAPDLAAALVRAADGPTGTFAVADPRVYAWSEVVDEIATALGRRPLRLRLPVPLVRSFARVTEAIGHALGRVVTFNREKAEEMLAPGWVCELAGSEPFLDRAAATPLREGVAETVRWYKRQGWL